MKIKLTDTRHPTLKLGHINGKFWQFCDMSSGKPSQVGPQYKTKAEAFTLMEDFFDTFGR